MKENIDYIGFVYQFGVKGLRARSMFRISSCGGQACINRHQIGVEENSNYIGVVYQFGVKGMRARKHVLYQFRVEGRDV